MRIGFGYDLHPLVEGRQLIIGGVMIPFEKGLDGHSDADVLCHAISDALLGAAALGDIGEHFLDTDPVYKDASSIVLLSQVGRKVTVAGYLIENIDSTVIAELPKLLLFKKPMIKTISNTLNLNPGVISIKAKTNEGFGPVGRGQAIAAYAVVLLKEKRE